MSTNSWNHPNHKKYPAEFDMTGQMTEVAKGLLSYPSHMIGNRLIGRKATARWWVDKAFFLLFFLLLSPSSPHCHGHTGAQVVQAIPGPSAHHPYPVCSKQRGTRKHHSLACSKNHGHKVKC